MEGRTADKNTPFRADLVDLVPLSLLKYLPLLLLPLPPGPAATLHHRTVYSPNAGRSCKLVNLFKCPLIEGIKS